jgi:abortive infection bacteriophage resistance protein
MSKPRAFSKKPLQYQKLTEKLIARGLIVEDLETATHHIKNIGYYRLTGYGLSFEERGKNGERLHL